MINSELMSHNELEANIERHFAAGASAVGAAAAMEAFLSLRSALEAGELRSASPDAASPTGWRVNAWVKRGILLGFRLGVMQEFACGPLSFIDKHTYPARQFGAGDGIRVVPGGSSVRAGAYLAKGVVCMPPMYVNVGAYIDEGTMVDSHALVGSCAQSKLRSTIAASVPGSFNAIAFVDNTGR